MPTLTALRSRFLVISGLFCLLGGGCSDGPTSSGEGLARGSGGAPSADRTALPGGQNDPEPYLGQYDLPNEPPARFAGSGDRGSESHQQPIDTREWGIVLKSFGAEGHETAARTMVSQLGQIDPMLTKAWIQSSERGSMVVYGRYQGPDDASAKRDLEQIKSITFRDRPAFRGAYLARVVSDTDKPLHPHALMSARKAHPRVDPMYTLDIAVWGTDEQRASAWREVQRKAEGYCAQLRTQGHEAYFHHDATTKLSTVTVGLFDRTVSDASSPLSSRLAALREQFPIRLVNGEPLQMLKDPLNPDAGTRPQPSQLVEVPRM